MPTSSTWETLVLGIVSDGPIYGYEIARRLNALGIGEVRGGTLYPLLRRLTDSGWLEAHWRSSHEGPRRRYYELTGPGAEELALRRSEWLRTRSAMDQILAGVE